MATWKTWAFAVLTLAALIHTAWTAAVWPSPVQVGKCVQTQKIDYRPSNDTCAQFYRCDKGILTKFFCADGHVFYQAAGSCVPAGSALDICTSQLSDRKASNPVPIACAKDPTSKIADETNCASYYDCSKPSGQFAGRFGWKTYQFECKWPKLFNKDTQRCEHYSKVECGKREEPFDPCDYKIHQCHHGRRAVCRPCQLYYPSCRGMPNGINGWEGKSGIPDFVFCKDQRIVGTARCSQDFNGPMIFDSQLKVCRRYAE